jgi:hypothetical protein
MLADSGATLQTRIELFYSDSVVMFLVRLIALAVIYCAKLFCDRFHSEVSLCT